jgi:putative transposase
VGLSIAGPEKAGMRAPVFAVGDGALGFWGAMRDAFPQTHHQRDWVHKTANVLDALPKSVHERSKKATKEITEAEITKPKRGRPSRSLRRNSG